jgi:hypothetical protein
MKTLEDLNIKRLEAAGIDITAQCSTANSAPFFEFLLIQVHEN